MMSFQAYSINTLWASPTHQANLTYNQWFTGSILTPSATTLPPSHPALELELIGTKIYGFYDSKWTLHQTPAIWGIQPLFDFQMSFTNRLGIEFIGSAISYSSQGASSTYASDSTFRLGFQISTDKQNTWIPDFRILFQETFPTGHYNKLNPKRKGTDSTGEGSFQSGLQLVIQKLFFGKEKHPLRLRGSIGFFAPSSVFVKGINYYGGDPTTRGTVLPGNYLMGFAYGEFALNSQWAIACEVNYFQGKKGQFLRNSGPDINIPAYSQFSILPEIQHTFSENFGIIIGGWFTLAGKNSQAFNTLFFTALFIF